MTATFDVVSDFPCYFMNKVSLLLLKIHIRLTFNSLIKRPSNWKHQAQAPVTDKNPGNSMILFMSNCVYIYIRHLLSVSYMEGTERANELDTGPELQRVWQCSEVGAHTI